jgi:hypothetical protein
MTRAVRYSTALILILAACDSATQPRQSFAAKFTTDDSVYTAVVSGQTYRHPEYEFTLVASYFNPTPDTVFFEHCRTGDLRPLYYLTLVAPSDTGGAAYNRVDDCGGTLDRGVPVAPHTTFVDTLVLSGPNEWDASGNPVGNTVAGHFRLAYLAYVCSGPGACPVAPDSLRYSAPFEVRLTPPSSVAR